MKTTLGRQHGDLFGRPALDDLLPAEVSTPGARFFRIGVAIDGNQEPIRFSWWGLRTVKGSFEEPLLDLLFNSYDVQELAAVRRKVEAEVVELRAAEAMKLAIGVVSAFLTSLARPLAPFLTLVAMDARGRRVLAAGGQTRLFAPLA